MRNIFREQEGVSSFWWRSAGRLARRAMNILLMFSCVALLFQFQHSGDRASALADNHTIYLPFVKKHHPVPTSASPAIHIPYINDESSYSMMDTRYSELGVFWFGKVTSTDNYSDVRVGYNPYVLLVNIASIDQQLWFDRSRPPAENFHAWDSTSVYISIPGSAGQESRLVRLDAELSEARYYEDREQYKAAYQLIGGQWSKIDFSFRTDADWRGEGPNASPIDEGWNVTYRISLSGLGFSSAPPSGTKLKMAIKVYDKDTATQQTSGVKFWPNDLQEKDASTYGAFTFGYPIYQRPANAVAGTVNIKQSGTDKVEDASVGGFTTCGNYGVDKWTHWGFRVFNQTPASEVAVIQNQQLIADWPCFSRYYITFPLDRVPQGKVILSAKLTMIHYGGSSVSLAEPSYIQVLRVNQPWNPETITWNNAPQAVENYPGTWVPPYDVLSSGVPGVARTWDVSKALVDVYGTGEPLRLALYSADKDMHSGKYFRSSETASWGDMYPPKLTIEWGNP